MKQVIYPSLILLTLFSSTVNAVELSGNISLQSQAFFNDPLDPNQHNQYSSFAVQPELYQKSDNSRQSMTFIAFHRHDHNDEERSHSDIRELSWTGVYDGFEITAGISKVFWGVTETQHLVDIINQTDQVEGIDGEDKLGQPMIRFSTEQNWGVLDMFILPGFRERTFTGIEGRPRFEIAPGLNFNADTATYESDKEEKHIDYATRWLGIFDEIELGLSYFTGTSREPTMVLNGTTLSPHYLLIKQIGIDVQAIIEDWTWKLEAVSRKSSADNYIATTAGFEYTLYGIFGGDSDLGIVIEYLYDDRNDLASSPFQNDITTALRLALNDTQSTEILLGLTTDLDDSVIASFIEASRRLGDSLKLTLEARAFNNTISSRPLHNFRQDNFVQADLAWYF
ncbi:MAG: hypothetical protein OEM07_04210 [Gammaproteobacteria bacterium]|nr:hypothetical protein [Gammaproteobacteria bacterium]